MNKAIEESLFPSELSAAIREKFLYVDSDPITGNRLYLENAGGGLTLKQIFEEDRRIGGLPDNAGRRNRTSREIEAIMGKGRRDVTMFLNSGNRIIWSEQSTSGCAFRLLDAVGRGTRGSNIVCSQLDHAAFYDATALAAERYGLERRIAPLDPRTGSLKREAFDSCVDEKTAAVTLIHASNITGGKNDLHALVAKIRSRSPDAFIIVDGAQHVQHSLIDVEDYEVDAYIFSAYKVFSKAGFAFACLTQRIAEMPHFQLAGKAPFDWDLGTRDPSGFAAFSSVVDYLCWLGTQISPQLPRADRRGLLCAGLHGMECHEAALSRRLLEGSGNLPGILDYKNITLHGTTHPFKGREAVFAFSVKEFPTGKLVEAFNERNIIIHDRVNDAYSGHTLNALGVEAVVRVSFAHYNTVEDVDQFLRALKEIIQDSRL